MNKIQKNKNILEEENYNIRHESEKDLLTSQLQTFSTQQSDFYSKLIHTISLEDLTQTDNARIRLPFLVISPFSTFKKSWTVMIALCLFYISWTFPFRISFENDFSADIMTDFLFSDIVIDSIFLADILVNALSAYEDEEGGLVYSKIMIFANYIKFWFWLDAISSFPFYLITTHNTLVVLNKIFKLLRLPKILRLITVKNYFKLKNLPIYGRFHKYFGRFLASLDQSLSVSLLKIIYWFFFLIHLSCCLWYYVIQIEKESDADAGNTWVIRYSMLDSTMFEKYIAALFFVLTVMITIGYGTITPVTYNETILTIFLMFFGILFYGKLTSILIEIYGKMRNQYQNYKDRSDQITEISKKSGFSRRFHERVMGGIMETGFDKKLNTFEKYVQMNFFQDLNETILSEVILYLFHEEVKNFVFFEGKPPLFITRLLFLVKTETFLKGEEIYVEGETAHSIYFLLKGRVAGDFPDSNKNKMTISYTQGSYFGDIEVFSKSRRQMSIFARTDGAIWTVDSTGFLKILEDYPEIEAEMLEIGNIKKIQTISHEKKYFNNPAFFPMNYWRWHHEKTLKKPLIENALYKGEDMFSELGKEYFTDNIKIVLKEMEAKQFLSEQNLSYFDIDENEIYSKASKNLENDFFLRFFDNDFKNFEVWLDKFNEMERKDETLKKFYETVDQALAEIEKIWINMKSIERLL